MIALATVPFAFLGGLLRSRVAGAVAVTGLVARLGGDPRPGALRDALAAALGDRSLALAYWLPEREQWVDAAGAPFAAAGARLGPRVHAGRARRPAGGAARPRRRAEERELVAAVGGAAALALENARLDAELRANVAELRASRARIVESADAARRRIERDLHDGAQQQLVAVALALRTARRRVERDPDAAGELLDHAADDLDAAIRALRDLARGIHPAVLSDRGLASALEALAQRAPLPVEIDGCPAGRLPEPVEAAAYFVVAEAITNVVRYAPREPRAACAVTRDDGRLAVAVADDGVGGADPGNGSGLRGLADRVAALDGRLEVRSDAGRRDDGARDDPVLSQRTRSAHASTPARRAARSRSAPGVEHARGAQVDDHVVAAEARRSRRSAARRRRGRRLPLTTKTGTRPSSCRRTMNGVKDGRERPHRVGTTSPARRIVRRAASSGLPARSAPG